MNSLISGLMSLIKLQKIPTSYFSDFPFIIRSFCKAFILSRLDWSDLKQSVTYFSGENWSMGGSLILINSL